jgi:hypothetical protein
MIALVVSKTWNTYCVTFLTSTSSPLCVDLYKFLSFSTILSLSPLCASGVYVLCGASLWRTLPVSGYESSFGKVVSLHGLVSRRK